MGAQNFYEILVIKTPPPKKIYPIATFKTTARRRRKFLLILLRMLDFDGPKWKIMANSAKIAPQAKITYKLVHFRLFYGISEMICLKRINKNGAAGSFFENFVKNEYSGNHFCYKCFENVNKNSSRSKIMR